MNGRYILQLDYYFEFGISQLAIPIISLHEIILYLSLIINRYN